MKKQWLIRIMIVASLGSPVLAEVRLPTLFSDNMVLQQGVPIPIWGWGQLNEQVTVRFGSQTVSASTRENGKWILHLAPMPASNQPMDMIIEGKANTITIKNIFVGEVWLASGQSNMVQQLGRTFGGEELLKRSLTQIR